MKAKRKFLILLFGMLLGTLRLSAQSPVIVILELQDEIHPSSARYISKGMDFAEQQHAALVLIHMNTYGGMVQYADSIRSRILDSRIPTAVLIDKNAASAGALISIACDSIFMVPGSSIGAATVVNGNNGEAMPDKYQSYMRATMRATAERKGRDPKIAEKMVDQNLEIEGLSPKGTVITFTAREAKEHGYANAILDSKSAVLSHMGLSDAKVEVYENSMLESLIQFLIHPAVAGILVMLIFGGLFLELKTPGFGFPGIIAITAALLFFAPHYIEGLAQSWEILVFAAGLVLLALEIFVVPGFGITGISGIILTVAGLGIALVRNDVFDFSNVNTTEMLRSFAVVVAAMATSLILAVWIARNLVSERRAFPFVDTATQNKEAGYTAVKNEIFSYVGMDAECITDLKPAGFIRVNDKKLDAESEGEFIERGTAVKVVAVKNVSLVVRKS